MISIKQQKEFMIPRISEILKPRKFEYIDSANHMFIKDCGNRILKLNFYFSNSGFSGNSLYTITFKAIEKIILEIGLPNIKTHGNQKELVNLSTIYDRETEYIFTDRPLNLGSKEEHVRKKITTQKHLTEWLQAFKHYLDFDGHNFEKQHSTILELHSKIIDLKNRGDKHFGKLILGGIDHLFRALIIFRLCNDPNYYQEELNFDTLILKDKYAKWHPHYKKLKQILRETSPVYKT